MVSGRYPRYCERETSHAMLCARRKDEKQQKREPRCIRGSTMLASGQQCKSRCRTCVSHAATRNTRTTRIVQPKPHVFFPAVKRFYPGAKPRRPRASCQTNCLIRISVALFRGELNTALIRRHRRWLFIATRRERFSRPDRNIVGMERWKSRVWNQRCCKAFD